VTLVLAQSASRLAPRQLSSGAGALTRPVLKWCTMTMATPRFSANERSVASATCVWSLEFSSPV
jgi:hypothetical protein